MGWHQQPSPASPWEDACGTETWHGYGGCWMLLCLPSVPAAGPAEVRMGWPRDGHSQKRAEPRVWPHLCPQEPRMCTQGSLRCRGLHWEGDRRLEEEEESAGGLCMAVLLGRWLNGPSPKAKVWKSSRHQLPTPFGQDPGHQWGSTSVQEPILASGLPPTCGTRREGAGCVGWGAQPCSHK